jgi:hypothetical protein
MMMAYYYSRFIRTEEDDRADDSREAWEKRLARRYYERLYREYCIADLTRYREGQVGMRWRVEKEVIIGKGTPCTTLPSLATCIFIFLHLHLLHLLHVYEFVYIF